MDTRKIDVLNIGLIGLSLLIAIKIPFKLFLFSYAVLGPLHYLTEINWLREKKYFIPTKVNWALLFLIATVLVSIYPILDFFNSDSSALLKDHASLFRSLNTVTLLSAFLFAVALIFIKKVKQLLMVLPAVIIITYLSSVYLPKPVIMISIFLPTLIHVYVFTWLFILFGAFKAKANSGFYLAAVLFCVPFVISFLPIDQLTYQASNELKSTFSSSNMLPISAILANFFTGEGANFNPLSEIGLRIQIFIAFAYTYHYLNWFSKTSIIGWKKSLNSKKLLLILFIWIASVALYWYDFKTGFLALFFLSFLHVLLEFPLNAITIRELFRMGKSKKSS